ncbi:hypothetical protein ABLT31_34570 [Ammoniphilus sp. 3BR4]
MNKPLTILAPEKPPKGIEFDEWKQLSVPEKEQVKSHVLDAIKLLDETPSIEKEVFKLVGESEHWKAEINFNLLSDNQIATDTFVTFRRDTTLPKQIHFAYPIESPIGKGISKAYGSKKSKIPNKFHFYISGNADISNKTTTLGRKHSIGGNPKDIDQFIFYLKEKFSEGAFMKVSWEEHGKVVEEFIPLVNDERRVPINKPQTRIGTGNIDIPEKIRTQWEEAKSKPNETTILQHNGNWYIHPKKGYLVDEIKVNGREGIVILAKASTPKAEGTFPALAEGYNLDSLTEGKTTD